MINGEGPHEDVSGTTSSDLFDSFPPKLSGGGDASPGSLSQYSSCGGESEFEKYCSANSVMGTPSFCGSFVPLNDFTESEFGSLRSLDGSLENFSLGGRFDRNMEEQKMSGSGLDCLKGNIKEGIAENGSNRLEMDDGEITCGESSGMNIGLGSRQECVNVGRNERDLSGSDVRNGLNFMSAGFDSEREMDGEEDGTSSRYEHSEDDDSMYGCGSDDENRKSLYTPRNIQYCKEAKVENENPLLINTSVAFGSEDWDDFEQETGGGTLSSLSLNEFQEQKEQNFEAESSLVNSKSVATIGVPVVGLIEIGEDVTAELPGTRLVEGNELVEDFNSSSVVPFNSQNSDLKQAEKVRDVPVAICHVQGTHEIVIDDKITPITSSHLRSFHKLEQEDVKDISVVCSLVEDANDRMEHFKRCSASDIFEMKQDPFVEKNHMGFGSNVVDCSMEREGLCEKSVDIIHVDGGKVLEKQGTQSLELKPGPLSDSPNLCSHPTEYFDNGSAEFIEDHKPNSARLLIESNRTRTMKNTPTSVDLSEDHPAPVKAEKVELDEFYDEIVNEMEEILLDSSESQGARFPQGNRMSQAQLSLPVRDGGSTASTSGAGDAFPQPLRIDGIEVVGAKQKKGDVSLSERLVGVKEFTVYVIRVWSGKDQWEVERRYRDFFTLYRRLKSLFTDQGWTLPLPWSSVEKESRKIFGNASPDVVSMRSVLIQECLHSIIHSRYFASPPSALLWFLCPQDSLPSSPLLQKPVPLSVFSNRGGEPGNISTLGKTISLVVEIRAYKSTKQLLEAQHYTCAGCHKHFDDGVTLVRDFAQVLGWGKPRLCEYTGQLFCSSCHTNETAVLPARVLHHWDFSHYPVSQLAKLYLDSIHEQPMLCVSAVNPFLFSKVPALQHIMSVRKRIGSMLPYVRCPFRRTINRGLGSHKYLLESNDFFALKDLIDLSKGAFAALPMMMETVSSKLLEHITDQCLICCDVGIPCSARQACNDPSSLIFPFQEGEIERCKSCESVFHKPCFKRLTNCTCGAVIGKEKTMEATNKLIRKASGLLGRRSSSGLSMGFLSGLFPRAKPETMNELKDHDTVILMGSLPSSSL